MIPLYGFFHGDTMGLLILSSAEEKVSHLIAKLKKSVRVRVEAKADLKLVFNGQVLPPEMTLAAAGMQALDVFEVIVQNTDEKSTEAISG